MRLHANIEVKKIMKPLMGTFIKWPIVCNLQGWCKMRWIHGLPVFAHQPPWQCSVALHGPSITWSTTCGPRHPCYNGGLLYHLPTLLAGIFSCSLSRILNSSRSRRPDPSLSASSKACLSSSNVSNDIFSSIYLWIMKIFNYLRKGQTRVIVHQLIAQIWI